MLPGQDQPLNVHLFEYYKLKDEQLKRMEFRDNMLYWQLLAVGAVAAWALTEGQYLSLLIIPWVCFILGWMYLVNDDRVSALGQYIRQDLGKRVQELSGLSSEPFGWEIAHRSDPRRVERKVWQFVVDELAFVVSGLVFLAFFSWTFAHTGTPETGKSDTRQMVRAIDRASIAIAKAGKAYELPTDSSTELDEGKWSDVRKNFIWVIVGAETLLLFVLAWMIYSFADFKRGG